jgi:hypothetical protein
MGIASGNGNDPLTALHVFLAKRKKFVANTGPRILLTLENKPSL